MMGVRHSPKGVHANAATVAAAIAINGIEAVRASGVPAQVIAAARARIREEIDWKADRIDRIAESRAGRRRRLAARRARIFGPASLDAMARPFWLRFGAALAELHEHEAPLRGERLVRLATEHGADVAERLEGLDGARRAALALRHGLDLSRLRSVADVMVRGQSLRPHERVIRRACRLFGVTRTDLMSARRARELVAARAFAAFWVKRLTPFSYPQMARLFGGRDHTTVLHAVRVWPERRAEARRLIAAARKREAQARERARRDRERTRS